MKHPFSPIRHDYKPLPEKKIRNKNLKVWFSLSFSLPVFSLILYFFLYQPSKIIESSEPNMPNQEDISSSIESMKTNKTNIRSNSNNLLHSESTIIQKEINTLNILPEENEILTLFVKEGDTLERIFKQNKLNLGHLAQIVNLKNTNSYLKKVLPDDKLIIKHKDGNLIELYREINLTQALIISKQENGFNSIIVERPITIKHKTIYGAIGSSLFESAAEIGLSDKTVMNLAGIFAWDIDFVLDIRAGDSYYVLFEQLYQNNEYIGDGEIVAAEFNNNKRSLIAVRYINENGRSDYFSPDGRSVRKAFIRAPVDFTRISSNFNPQRKHPVLNTIRAHKGVDYAAPRGTPVKAAGDGKIILRGNKGGYGKTVILQHGGNISTLYGHLNAFDRNATYGKTVKQGQIIGYVGMTGLATGPHLHYEYQLNGVHRNPRTVKLPQAEPIAKKQLVRFHNETQPILEKLQAYKANLLASVQSN